MTKLLFSSFFVLGCCGILQAAVPCVRNNPSYPSTVYVQQPSRTCPCGCGCQDPCYCGCRDGHHPCTCHR